MHLPHTWVLASGNAGKLKELRALLAPLALEVAAQSEYGVPDVAEDGIAFVDNALIKARHAAAHTGLPAIADDSGLAVKALAGAPGIHSARYAGGHGDDDANNSKLLAALEDGADNDRAAAFHCCLVATRHAEDPAPVVCQGVWRGRVLRAPRGTQGFGYDSLFWVDSEGASAAELDAARKNRLSHRGQAMAQLLIRLQANG